MKGKKRSRKDLPQNGSELTGKKSYGDLVPWLEPEYDAALEYATMRSLFFDCWACGANSKPFD